MMSQEAFMQRVNEITAENTEKSQQSANAMMKFQAEMSNTAHQREVEDLRAAGLNPMLSVNNGASTPNGAMAQVDMSGASALAQWNSASAALQGALANAGAIIRSAELSYQAQRDFPNTWSGLASRLIDDLGLRGTLRSAITGYLGSDGKVDYARLIQDALKVFGFKSGSPQEIATQAAQTMTNQQWQLFKNWISTHWKKYASSPTVNRYYYNPTNLSQ